MSPFFGKEFRCVSQSENVESFDTSCSTDLSPYYMLMMAGSEILFYTIPALYFVFECSLVYDLLISENYFSRFFSCKISLNNRNLDYLGIFFIV